MNDPDALVSRNHFLLVGEYLDYLLTIQNRNRKSVDRYRLALLTSSGFGLS